MVTEQMGIADRQVSFADALSFLLGAWKWLAAGFFFGALLGLLVIVTAKPVYRSRIVLAPITNDAGADALSRISGQLGSLSGVIGAFGGGGANSSRATNVATLRSRAVVESFVASNDLMPVLFPERWDQGTNTWKSVDGGSQQPTMDDAVLLFDESIRRIGDDPQTGLITVSIDWADPEVASRWANDLVAATNELIRARAIEELRRNVAFLEAELQKTNVLERQQIIYRLIESRTSEIMLASGRVEYAFTVIDRATPPDKDKYVWPRRRIILALCLLFGLTLALVGAVVANIWGRISSGRLRNGSLA